MHRKWLILALAPMAACVRVPASAAPTPLVASEDSFQGNNGADAMVLVAGEAASPLDSSMSEREETPAVAVALTDSVQPAPLVDAGPTWDIDVRSYENTDRVEHYVKLFSGSAKESFEARLNRGSRYEAMIRAKFREGGLPEDMYYLALVESGFNPNAYSSAAAVGMWQFLASTARGVGLRVDWWIDERRDPVRSTAGAVRFLGGLEEQFGSLYLAAAAYNGGPGRVARGLSRYADDLEGTSGDDLFFALADKDYLRRETREYVPQLIAAALIAKEPSKYGLQLQPQSPFMYDSVRVGPTVALAAIAKAAGTTVSVLQELNPQILRGMTPPHDSLSVRIPPGTAASFDSTLAALPKEARIGVTTLKSRAGEHTADVARRAGVSARTITTYNPRLKRGATTGKLVSGQTVLIPTKSVRAAALSVADPNLERYGSAARIHVVKSGETLSEIAEDFDTTVRDLKALNGLKRDVIYVGQELAVPAGRR